VPTVSRLERIQKTVRKEVTSKPATRSIILEIRERLEIGR